MNDGDREITSSVYLYYTMNTFKGWETTVLTMIHATIENKNLPLLDPLGSAVGPKKLFELASWKSRTCTNKILSQTHQKARPYHLRRTVFLKVKWSSFFGISAIKFGWNRRPPRRRSCGRSRFVRAGWCGWSRWSCLHPTSTSNPDPDRNHNPDL